VVSSVRESDGRWRRPALPGRTWHLTWEEAGPLVTVVVRCGPVVRGLDVAPMWPQRSRAWKARPDTPFSWDASPTTQLSASPDRPRLSIADCQGPVLRAREGHGRQGRTWFGRDGVVPARPEVRLVLGDRRLVGKPRRRPATRVGLVVTGPSAVPAALPIGDGKDCRRCWESNLLAVRLSSNKMRLSYLPTHRGLIRIGGSPRTSAGWRQMPVRDRNRPDTNLSGGDHGRSR
jgi:hypothetical protein